MDQKSKLEKPSMTFAEMLARVFHGKSTPASFEMKGKPKAITASKILQDMSDREPKRKKFKITTSYNPDRW